MNKLLAALLVLTIMDGALTVDAVRAGDAVELNPVMVPAVGQGYITTFALKAAPVLMLWALIRLRPITPKIPIALLAVYAGVIGWHVLGLTVLS